MAEAILIYDKPNVAKRLPWTPVKVSYEHPVDTKYSYTLLNMKFGKKGVLLSFSVILGGITRFYQYVSELSDYYRKDSYSEYKKGNLRVEVINNHQLNYGFVHKFPIIEDAKQESIGFRLANTEVNQEDTITVNRLDPEPNLYDYYYHLSKYKFLAEFDSENKLKTYTHINQFPNNATVQSDDVDLNDSPTGHFYAKNFGQYIQNLSWDDLTDPQEIDEKKKNLAIQMTLLCWQIHWIIEDSILDKLAIKPIVDIKLATYDKYKTNNPSSTDYDGMQRIDQLIGELLRDWGYLTDTDKFSSPVEAVPILSNTPNVDEILSYHNTLISLYHSLLYENEETMFPEFNGFPVDAKVPLIYGTTPNSPNYLSPEQDSERRISRLYASLYKDLSIFSTEDKINLLRDFIKKPKVKQDSDREIDEKDILMLLASIAPNDVNVTPDLASYNEANAVLDFLLKVDDGDKTNFEILYYLMDDKFADNIAFVEWFVDEANNKQQFVNILHRIWYISKYNFEMTPNTITPTDDGFNPMSYFLNDGASYFPEQNENGLFDGINTVFEFSLSSQGVGFSNEVRYVPTKFNKELITIKKEVENYSLNGEYTIEYDSDSKEVGNFHIYQPIVLIGYKPNQELNIPNQGPLPAFVFLYTYKATKSRDLAALVSLSVELTVEVGLFFLTGGVTQIRHLRHLKHVTKLRHAKKTATGIQWGNGFQASEKILFWQGLTAVSELTSVISASAGVISSFAAYQINTQNNNDLKQLNKTLTYVFMGLSLLSAGGALAFSRRTSIQVAKSSKDVVKEIDRLTNLIPPKPHNVPNDVLNLIHSIDNAADITKSVFFNRVVNLSTTELGAPNKIQTVFANFDDIQKNDFFNDFGDKLANPNKPNSTDDIAFWKAMNEPEIEKTNISFSPPPYGPQFDSEGNPDFKYSNSIDAARVEAWLNFSSNNISPSYKSQKLRGNISVLDAIIYYKKNPAQLSKYKQVTSINGDFTQGGHFGPKFLDSSLDIFGIRRTASNIRTRTRNFGTRTYTYENLVDIRKKGWSNPQNLKRTIEYPGNSGTFIDVKAKKGHSWVDGMTEEEFDLEIAILFSKVEKQKNTLSYDSSGRKYFDIKMTDNCPVKMVMVEEISINGTTHYDYITTMFFNI
jgi:hypothetical protein